MFTHVKQLVIQINLPQNQHLLTNYSYSLVRRGKGWISPSFAPCVKVAKFAP